MPIGGLPPCASFYVGGQSWPRCLRVSCLHHHLTGHSPPCCSCHIRSSSHTTRWSCGDVKTSQRRNSRCRRLRMGLKSQHSLCEVHATRIICAASCVLWSALQPGFVQLIPPSCVTSFVITALHSQQSRSALSGFKLLYQFVQLNKRNSITL